MKIKYVFKLFVLLLTILFLVSCLGNKSGNTLEVLDLLEKDKFYIVLLSEYPGIREIAEVAGLQGEYGHVELVYNKTVYGARPSICHTMTFIQFAEKFNGSRYEIREIPFPGEINKALDFYRKNVEGQKYNLYYKSCTSIINDMYAASTGYDIPVKPIDVGVLHERSETIRNFMKEKGLLIPDRNVWLPDQFTHWGKEIKKGRI